MSDYEDEYEDEYEVDDLNDEGKFPLSPVDLAEDTFGMSVCALVHDTFYISKQGCNLARVCRLVSSLFLVLLTIVIQVWLLQKVKEFVCARSVHDIRIAYDKYQLHMYGAHTTLTVNGKHRGIPGFFPAMPDAIALLDAMSAGDQDDICRIPLSQPYFFGLILLIWTLTCIAELRKAFDLQTVIMMLPTVDSMKKALVKGDDDSTVIEGMTVVMKIGLTLLTFVPRLLVTLYLLWVGCRWLLATTCFGDLILNAVALEFILLIKDGLYTALMPHRSHLDLTSTKILPYPTHMHTSCWNFVNTISLLLVAFLWVFCYMKYWQQVLPQYNWDVHEVCEHYIKERFAV